MKKVFLLMVAALTACIVWGQQTDLPAPTLKVVEWVQGDPVDPSETEGLFVVELWATWCAPCRASFPHLAELKKRYGEDLTILGLSNDDPEVLRTFLKDHPEVTWTIASEHEGRARYGQLGNVTGIPHTFIVRDRRIIWHGHPRGGLETELMSLLGPGHSTAETGREEPEGPQADPAGTKAKAGKPQPQKPRTREQLPQKSQPPKPLPLSAYRSLIGEWVTPAGIVTNYLIARDRFLEDGNGVQYTFLCDPHPSAAFSYHVVGKTEDGSFQVIQDHGIRGFIYALIKVTGDRREWSALAFNEPRFPEKMDTLAPFYYVAHRFTKNREWAKDLEGEWFDPTAAADPNRFEKLVFAADGTGGNFYRRTDPYASAGFTYDAFWKDPESSLMHVVIIYPNQWWCLVYRISENGRVLESDTYGPENPAFPGGINRFSPYYARLERGLR